MRKISRNETAIAATADRRCASIAPIDAQKRLISAARRGSRRRPGWV